jgi:hypothetical protein
MDPMVLAAGTALVGTMATDAWQHSRAAVIGLWRQFRPVEADGIGQELEELRAAVVATRSLRDDDVQAALAGVWHVRLQQLIAQSPGAIGPLERVLREALLPALPADDRARIGTLTMKARASGSARIYQTAGDQHITDT